MQASPLRRRVAEAAGGLRDPHADAVEPRRRGAVVHPTLPAPLPVSGALLLATISAALLARGASQAWGQRTVAGLLLAAAVAALLEAGRLQAEPSSLIRGPRTAPARPPRALPLLGAIAAWAVVSAAVSGDARRAMPTVATLAGVGAVIVLSSRLGVAHRRTLVTALGAIGVIVAGSAWIGVAWRIDPLVTSGGVHAGAGILTYTNATAAILVPLTLVALAIAMGRGGSARWTVTACLMLTGLGATASRGGLLTLALGFAVLAAGLGARPALRAVAAPVLGAVVALAGLLPSMPAGSDRRPLLALVSLVAGVTVAGALPSGSVSRLRLLTAVGGLAAMVALAIGPTNDAIREIVQQKAATGWSDRAQLTREALDVAARHPLAGAGPTVSRVDWMLEDGRTMTLRHAHNEYAQVLADLGVIGFLLLLALLLTLARSVARGRPSSPSPEIWVACVAGLTAFAVHSAVDVLWHVPALPLAMALLVGVNMSETEGDR